MSQQAERRAAKSYPDYLSHPRCFLPPTSLNEQNTNSLLTVWFLRLCRSTSAS
jgi:hypothetical protein